MSAAAQPGQQPYYFVPAPSRHPAMAAIGLFFLILGAGQWINGHDWGKYSVLLGFVIWALTLVQWFGYAIRESENGLYSDRIDVSFRWKAPPVKPSEDVVGSMISNGAVGAKLSETLEVTAYSIKFHEQSGRNSRS